jgi:hypothetical protein
MPFGGNMYAATFTFDATSLILYSATQCPQLFAIHKLWPHQSIRVVALLCHLSGHHSLHNHRALQSCHSQQAPQRVVRNQGAVWQRGAGHR